MKFDLETDLRGLERDMTREGDDNYTNKMILEKDKTFEDLGNTRFKQYFELEEGLSAQKELEIKDFKAKREGVRI